MRPLPLGSALLEGWQVAELGLASRGASLAALVPVRRGCPWDEFYPVSWFDSTLPKSGIQGLHGRLGQGVFRKDT